MFALVVVVGCYYYFESERLSSRIENVSPIETYDIVICTILIGLLLEAVRRTVGYVLLIVIITLLLYGVFGYLLPGQMSFSNISWTNGADF